MAERLLCVDPFWQEVDETMLAGFLQTIYFAELDTVVAQEIAALQQQQAR